MKHYETDLPPSLDHSQPTSCLGISTVHPISHFVSYRKYSAAHKSYLAAITSNDEPKYFYQAMKKIQPLEANESWTLESVPQGKRAIDSKWVYKIKYKPNGEIEHYKTRLGAKGFTQIEGIDFRTRCPTCYSSY